VAKGYGFIVPDNGMPDVLLHATCLRRDGFQTRMRAPESSARRIAAPALPGLPRALDRHVERASSLAAAAGRTHVSVTPSSGFEKAEVKVVQPAARLRLSLTRRGTPDIFVHMETLRRYGLTELKPGQWVLVRFGDGPKGLMAAEVRPLDGGGLPSSH